MHFLPVKVEHEELEASVVKFGVSGAGLLTKQQVG